MKKAKQVALIGGGSLGDFPLASCRSFSAQLGPVKASSLRLASRIANSLGAGHPVKEYRELDTARLILIAVPPSAIGSVIAELAASTVSWPGKSAVLLSADAASDSLVALSAQGASVATICAIPGFENHRYLVEGDPPSVHEMRQLIESRDTHVFVIERENKAAYLLAQKCTGRLFFALAAAASDCLHYAGLSRSASAPILEKQLGESLRAFLRGGRRARPAPQDIERPLRFMSDQDPKLAHYLDDSRRLARQFLGDPETATAEGVRARTAGT